MNAISKSPLFMVAGEIRNMIYTYALTPDTPLSGKVTTSKPQEDNPKITTPHLITSANKNLNQLQYVSRQLNAETRGFEFRFPSTLHFTDFFTMDLFLNSCSAAKVSALKTIHFKFITNSGRSFFDVHKLAALATKYWGAIQFIIEIDNSQRLRTDRKINLRTAADVLHSDFDNLCEMVQFLFDHVRGREQTEGDGKTWCFTNILLWQARVDAEWEFSRHRAFQLDWSEEVQLGLGDEPKVEEWPIE